MDEVMAVWAEWVKPSAGLPTVQWSLLLAFAAAAGHLLQRHTGLPKVVGYSIVGALAGLTGFSGAAWPLQGVPLFLLELGVAVVLFESGGRIPLRWFRHNPMVLLQSLLESVLTAVAVYYILRWLQVRASVAEGVALISMAASPAVLSRVMLDTRAAGPVSERALALSTLSTFYALTLVSARAGTLHREETTLAASLYPVAVVLGVSFVVGAVMALALRSALRVMSPNSENTSILLIALIAAGTALAAHFGGSAPLAALIGGLMLKQLHPRPWAWTRQLGTAASLLTMLMFVLVSVVAAKADWNLSVIGLVAAVVLARAVAKIAGVSLANWGSGTSWRQAFWIGCAMSPMSSIALLLVSLFVTSSVSLGPRIASIALPAILMMEILGAIIATFAIYRAGESIKPWDPRGANQPGENSVDDRQEPVLVPPAPRAEVPPLEPFQHSAELSLGVELELQLVNTHDYDLAPYSDEMLRLMAKMPLPGSVVPEMTSSMIEISTGVCHSCSEVLGQLSQVRDALVRCADKLNIAVVGGGTHPFQQWHEQRIYDRPRFRQLSELYGYLSKQFTIFGQHVHIGCPDADSALLMLHRMSRYIPHFIALSASSPFVQGQDTQFDSARLNSVFAFPMSGRAPFTLRWEEFEHFFAKSTRTGVVKSMKDFYWDIRPKPEYGTIEIRVFDTPLTVDRAAALAGFVQSLGAWFLREQPFQPQEDDYMVYTYNRFQACRFGLEAVYVEPATGEQLPLREHILRTLEQVEPHAQVLGAGAAIDLLRQCADRGANDARWLRESYARERLLAETVRQAAERFRGRPLRG